MTFLTDEDRLRADYAACAAIIRRGSKSFHAASLLLPAAARRDAFALYAFCRQADDLIDLGEDPGAALGVLERRLDAAYAGRPEPTAVDRAFAATVAERGVPEKAFHALFEGFRWDLDGRRYETIGEVEDYAARVAGAVGVMMAAALGARTADAYARAADLGVAMQLTNIARDVGEDARAGRLYLPADWLAEAGVDADAFLARPAFNKGLGAVVRRLLDRAGALYQRGEAGIALLPADCRTGVRAAARIYAEIGRRIAEAGYDSVTRRAVTPTGRKLALAAGAFAPPLHAAATDDPPIAANAFLVDAALVAPAPRPVRRLTLDDQLAQALELLARLERTEAAERGAAK
ncbi:MAG: phytoene/squalene synthase family protein [Pseudomonadota bacterium]